MAGSSGIKTKKSLGVVFLTVFIDLVGFSIIFPLFPAMLRWYLPEGSDETFLAKGISLLERITPGVEKEFLVAVLFGGILGSLYSIVQFFSAPIWGKLSDQLGRRKILLITTTGTALSYLIWIFSGSFWLLVISRLLGGLMAGNISVATAAIADLTSRKDRSKGMAIIGVAFGLGFIVGPAIGGLSSLWSWVDPHIANTSFIALTPFSAPAFFALILALLNILWVWKAFPNTNPEKADKPVGFARIFNSFYSENWAVKKALHVYFLFIVAFSGMEFTLTFLALERLAYSPQDMTKLFLFVGFILLFGQGYLVRKYARKVGEANFVIIGMLSGFAGLLCLSLAKSTLIFYLGLTGLGLGIALGSPALSALVSLYSKDTEQGAELGRFRSLGALGRAIGPIIAAILFWAINSQNTYLLGASLLAFTAFLSLFLPKPHFEKSS